MCMALIGKHYFQNLQAWDEEGLARYLSIPQMILQKILAVLVAEGFLAETSDNPPRLLPARPAEQILLTDILSVMRQQGETADYGLKLPGDTTLDVIYAEMETAVSESLSQKSLRDISDVELNVISDITDRETA